MDIQDSFPPRPLGRWQIGVLIVICTVFSIGASKIAWDVWQMKRPIHVYDKTFGRELPGQVLSVFPSVSITVGTTIKNNSIFSNRALPEPFEIGGGTVIFPSGWTVERADAWRKEHIPQP